jgi:hypothetical protein
MTEQINVSISQTLYQRVRDLARIRNQPVADVLAEVLENALPQGDEPETSSEDAAVEQEMNAYIAMHDTLKQKYLGKHIAIFGGQLIDVDEDYGALYQRIEAQYPNQFVWLATVEEEPMPTLMFRSPRLQTTE